MKHETSPSNKHEYSKDNEATLNTHESKQSPVKKHESLTISPESTVDIESVRKSAELHAKGIDQYRTDHNNQPKPEQHHYLTKKIKKQVYQQTLNDIQTHLTNKEKFFSKLVHNDIIDNVSEAGSKTIARPSGILGGSIFMVIGGLIVIFIAKKIGFEVPYSLFLFLYIIGFIVFVICELLYNPLRAIFKRH